MMAKILVIGSLILIVSSLGSALYYLVKDPNQSTRSAKALTRRITLSIALFVFLLIAFSTGLIKPHGLNPSQVMGEQVDKTK